MNNDEKWAAEPVEEKTLDQAREIAEDLAEEKRIGAENVWLKMPLPQSDPEAEPKFIEVNLLQVINQLFMDMGHFDRRVRQLEIEQEPESPIIRV